MKPSAKAIEMAQRLPVCASTVELFLQEYGRFGDDVPEAMIKAAIAGMAIPSPEDLDALTEQPSEQTPPLR